MITLTIKGIPKETHQALKKRAAANRRSLNNEIIFTLESMFGGATDIARISQVRPSVKKSAKRK